VIISELNNTLYPDIATFPSRSPRSQLLSGMFFKIHFPSFRIASAPISYRNTLTSLYFILASRLSKPVPIIIEVDSTFSRDRNTPDPLQQYSTGNFTELSRVLGVITARWALLSLLELYSKYSELITTSTPNSVQPGSVLYAMSWL